MQPYRAEAQVRTFQEKREATRGRKGFSEEWYDTCIQCPGTTTCQTADAAYQTQCMLTGMLRYVLHLAAGLAVHLQAGTIPCDKKYMALDRVQTSQLPTMCILHSYS